MRGDVRRTLAAARKISTIGPRQMHHCPAGGGAQSAVTADWQRVQPHQTQRRTLLADSQDGGRAADRGARHFHSHPAHERNVISHRLEI